MTPIWYWPHHESRNREFLTSVLVRLSIVKCRFRVLLQETSGPPSIATSPSGTAKSGTPLEAALESRAPLEHRLRSTARMYRASAEPGSPTGSQRKAVAWQELEELECPVASSQVPCNRHR